MIGWLQPAVMVLLSLMSGFLGGWVVAFRMGSWRQRVEDRLGVAEGRLEKGNPAVDKVPIVIERVDAVIKTIDEFKEAFRDFTARVVTRAECDRRHGDG